MSNNPKNKLQEYAQARGLPLPTYDTEYVDDSYEGSGWASIVSIDGHQVCGDTCARKKDAEKSAASFALAIVLGSDEARTTKDFIPVPFETDSEDEKCDGRTRGTLLIDLENVNPGEKYAAGYAAYGFVGRCNHHAGRETFGPNDWIRVMTTDSAVSDAADIGMTYFAGKYAKTFALPIYVVTRDRFADALVSSLRRDLESVEIYHKTSLSFI